MCSPEKQLPPDHPARKWQSYDFRAHNLTTQFCRQTELMNQVTQPRGEVSKEVGPKPEAFPNHSTYLLPWPQHVITAGWDILRPKMMSHFLTLEELHGLKAALSASDTFFGRNYTYVQTAFSQATQKPQWEIVLEVYQSYRKAHRFPSHT